MTASFDLDITTCASLNPVTHEPTGERVTYGKATLFESSAPSGDMVCSLGVHNMQINDGNVRRWINITVIGSDRTISPVDARRLAAHLVDAADWFEQLQA